MPLLHATPADVIDRAIAAQSKMVRGSATFHFEASARGVSVSDEGTVDYTKGAGFTFHFIEKASDHRSDRIFSVKGSRLDAYDYYSDEEIRKSVPSGLSPGQTLSLVMATVPDPLRVVVDSIWLSRFLHGLPKIKAFKVSNSRLGAELSSSDPAHGSSLKVSFTKSGLISGFTVENPGSSFAWNIRYSGAYHPASIPSGGVIVQRFTPHSPPPKFASAEAKKVFVEASRAFRRLQTAKVQVVRPDHKSMIYWDRGKLRENGPLCTWSYDGKYLSVLVNGKFFRGKATHADALDYLAYFINGEDTLSRSFLLRSNLVDTFVAPQDTVEVIGKLNIDGVPATILQVKGESRKSSLDIRDRDHLLANTQTDNFGEGGRVSFHDEASYHYKPFKLDPGIFALSSKARPKPLPSKALKLTSKFNHPQIELVPQKGVKLHAPKKRS